MKKELVRISRWEAHKVTAGVWEWKLVVRKVSVPLATVQYFFGWKKGETPPKPAGDPHDARARVLQVRWRQPEFKK